MYNYTFVVTVYNCEVYLEECIISLLKQTINDFEILLIDDGSTDDSGRICDQYAYKYVNIRAIHKENGGVSSARNLGIENANSFYIIFVDCDDTMNEDFLQDVSQIIYEYNPDLIISGLWFDFYKKGKHVQSQLQSSMNRGLIGQSQVVNNIWEMFQGNILSSSCAKVYSMNLLKQYDLKFDENLKLYEDLEFVIRYLSKCNSVFLKETAYYHYRIILEANRYYSRIYDLDQVNNIIMTIDRTWMHYYSSYVNKEDANVREQMINIEYNILSQVISETLWKYLYKISLFCEKVDVIRNLSEYQRIYKDKTDRRESMSKEIRFIYKNRKISLWGWIFYRKNRHKVARFLKR